MSQKPTGDMSRIQVDNFEDWLQIQKNFTEAIMSCLPQVHVISDGVQEAVKAHLLQWRDTTFQLAKLNIRVNGRNLEDSPEDQQDTEPFNENLDRRIWSLNAERMALDKELGERRRKTPLDMECFVKELLNEPPSLNGDEEILAIVVPDESMTTAGDTFHGTVETIGNLNQKAPRVLERTRRAKSIAREISSLTT